MSVHYFPDKRNFLERIMDDLRDFTERHVVASDERISNDDDASVHINHTPRVTLHKGFVHPPHERARFRVIQGNPSAPNYSRVHLTPIKDGLRLVEDRSYRRNFSSYHRRSEV